MIKEPEDGCTPEKPYMGKRGPRATPPPGHPDRLERVQHYAETRKIIPKVQKLFPEPTPEEAAIYRQRRREEKAAKKRKAKTKYDLSPKWGVVVQMIEDGEMTMEQFVKRLSPEELARGDMKNVNGGFSGPRMKWIPAEFHRACVKELLLRGNTMWKENYLFAIETMTSIALDDNVDASNRIKAATFVIERIEGKVPERVEVRAGEPWQEILGGIVADLPPYEAVAVRKFPDVDATVVKEEVEDGEDQ